MANYLHFYFFIYGFPITAAVVWHRSNHKRLTARHRHFIIRKKKKKKKKRRKKKKKKRRRKKKKKIRNYRYEFGGIGWQRSLSGKDFASWPLSFVAECAFLSLDF
jgi:hypothetical protein